MRTAAPTTTSRRLRELVANRPLVEISAPVERAWRLRRHGLSTPTDAVDIVGLARTHCGLHAARQLTPWVTLHTRYPTATPALLRVALAQRQLLRLRCMRRTLHLVPLDLAPIVHSATLSQRIRPCQLGLQRSGASHRSLATLRRRGAEVLRGRELGYRQLESQLLASAPVAVKRRSDAVAVVRLIIKLMWEEGEVVVGDASPSLHHEHRTFALTHEAVPTLAVGHETTPEAVTALLRCYLTGYGPAHIADFQWWSGLGLADALPAWEAVEAQLVRVRVVGHHDRDMVALGTTVDELADAESQAAHAGSVRLLAYEDPALKGYFSSRWRYVDPEHQPSLFNSIGEARASVIVGGRVAAVWRWNRRTQAPELDHFRALSDVEARKTRHALQAVAAFLRAEPLLRS